MKKIFASKQYKKDYKRYRHNPRKIAELQVVIDMLAAGQPLPAKYFPHMLHGVYKGCMECHVEGDFLLVWFDEKRNVIELVRLGSHSELYG